VESEQPLKKNESGSIDTIPGINRTILLSALFLEAVVTAESVTYYLNAAGGLILYFAVLLGLITSGAVTRDLAKRKLWLALGLIPLVRILSLAIPITEISEIYWYILIAIPLLVGVLMVMRVLKYSFDNIGLNVNKAWIQSGVAVSGIGLGAIAYIILKPEGLIGNFSLQTAFYPALILLITTGLIEEMAFRGVIQRAAAALGSWGWVYIALIYTILQIGFGSALFCLFSLITSIFFGWIVKRTGSILGVCLAHGLLNIGLYLIFPYIL
jgi:uncharacterized protein